MRPVPGDVPDATRTHTCAQCIELPRGIVDHNVVALHELGQSWPLHIEMPRVWEQRLLGLRLLSFRDTSSPRRACHHEWYNCLPLPSNRTTSYGPRKSWLDCPTRYGRVLILSTTMFEGGLLPEMLPDGPPRGGWHYCAGGARHELPLARGTPGENLPLFACVGKGGGVGSDGSIAAISCSEYRRRCSGVSRAASHTISIA